MLIQLDVVLSSARTEDWAEVQRRSGLRNVRAHDSPVALVIYGPAGVGKSMVRRMLEEGDDVACWAMVILADVTLGHKP